MKTRDNIGGYVATRFILPKDVRRFVVKDNVCSISVPHYKRYEIDAKQKGISITVSSDRGDAGLIYNINGSVICKDSENLSILKKAETMLLLYQGTDYNWRVAGTDEYPLTVTVSPLTPQLASGFIGYEIKFTGSQLIEPPIVDM